MAREGMLYMLITPGDPGFKVSKDKKREKIHASFGKYVLICFPACPPPSPKGAYKVWNDPHSFSFFVFLSPVSLQVVFFQDTNL